MFPFTFLVGYWKQQSYCIPYHTAEDKTWPHVINRIMGNIKGYSPVIKLAHKDLCLTCQTLFWKSQDHRFCFNVVQNLDMVVLRPDFSKCQEPVATLAVQEVCSPWRFHLL